ncbi:hypothetical protein [Motiliproteus sediminis]|uniref:hypothetical protein n=1 Tax=Motiliproteus sediminis TaxID=1468178 RepID=UPI001AEFA419|nr:hypothetical protein [Motiliproteus sediminis]
MSLIFGQQKLRHTSRMNILVLVLTLFVVGSHCSVAMAQVSMSELERPDVSSHAAMEHHCGETLSLDADNGDGLCLDDHCPDSLTPLQTQSHKLSKQGLDTPDLLLAPSVTLPLARAGPCGSATELHSAEFLSPPLFTTLCVLRL